MIVVTGANGKLGRHVMEGLLKQLPAQQIVAAVRNPGNAQDLAAMGVTLRQADYNDAASLQAAFAGADKVLLISSNDLEHRMSQHKGAVDACKAAGIKLLAYTSILRADTSSLALAQDHKATEAYLRDSGVPYVFLRNGWYFENHTEALAAALEHGAILGAAHDGRFASASRADYAGAAIQVLTTDGHENKVYELAGDASFSLPELAAEVSRAAGKKIVYQNLPQQPYRDALASFGLPPALAEMLADADAGAAQGELDSSTHDLRTLLGRPTQTLREAIAAALSQPAAGA